MIIIYIALETVLSRSGGSKCLSVRDWVPSQNLPIYPWQHTVKN